MPVAGGGLLPTQDARLVLIPDALLPRGDGAAAYALHPALRFASSRLARAAKSWAATPAWAPIEWYAALVGAKQGASSLLAAALREEIPGDARQCWLCSPFAGRLGRDTVQIMPADMFPWDAVDAEWLAGMLQPMLSGDGITLLAHDACLLAVSRDRWDADPESFARVAGHVLPNRHPPGADGGRLMRLCAEMQMLLASRPSERRTAAGLPGVMGVWLWAPSDLSAPAAPRPAILAGDALIRACTEEGEGRLPVAIVSASESEAYCTHQGLPRHWLLAGDGHAVLVDTRAFPRLGRRPWQPRRSGSFEALVGRMRGIAGLEVRAA